MTREGRGEGRVKSTILVRCSNELVDKARTPMT